MSLLYNTAEVKRNFGYSSEYDSLEFELVGQNLVYMVAQGLTYFGLNMLIQYRFFWHHKSKTENSDEAGEPKTETKDFDDDDYVRLVKLAKTYTKCFSKKRTVAVKNLSLGLKKGECFGLLGRNGAGKTTTFKMITGEIPISEGDVLVNGKSVRNELYEVYKDLGYCPQNDALFPLLTAREHLYFYAMVRGIPEHNVCAVSDWALKRFELESMADRISSGNSF